MKKGVIFNMASFAKKNAEDRKQYVAVYDNVAVLAFDNGYIAQKLDLQPEYTEDDFDFNNVLFPVDVWEKMSKNPFNFYYPKDDKGNPHPFPLVEIFHDSHTEEISLENATVQQTDEEGDFTAAILVKDFKNTCLSYKSFGDYKDHRYILSSTQAKMIGSLGEFVTIHHVYRGKDERSNLLRLVPTKRSDVMVLLRHPDSDSDMFIDEFFNDMI